MKFLDLFAGIGGFRLGLEMAGHECIGHAECDPYCNKCGEYTLHKNHDTKFDYSVCTVCGTERKQFALTSYFAMHNPKEGEFHATDVRNIISEDLPEFDILTGGFPCQAFSVAGKRGGFSDTRGTLFFEIMRIARVRKPKYIFLENVKGLLSHDGGKTFGTILQAMGECGYDAEWQMCNSKNYGVPQNRERVFIVGHLRGASTREVFPLGKSNRKAVELQGQPQATNTLTARYTGEGSGSYIIEGEQYAQSKIKQIGNIDQHKRERNNPQTGRVYAVDGIAPTLSTMQGGGLEPKIVVENKTKVECLNTWKLDGEQTSMQDRIYSPHGVSVALTSFSNRINTVDPNNMLIRKLTPKECFRLQGFPDEYFERAAEVNSDSQLYKQAGNSVTVNVIYEIAKKL